MAIDTYMHNTGLSIIHLLWVSYVTNFLKFCNCLECLDFIWFSFTKHTQIGDMKQGLQGQTRGRRQGDFKDLKYVHHLFFHPACL
jgi:hypothetical protein